MLILYRVFTQFNAYNDTKCLSLKFEIVKLKLTMNDNRQIQFMGCLKTELFWPTSCYIRQLMCLYVFTVMNPYSLMPYFSSRYRSSERTYTRPPYSTVLSHRWWSNAVGTKTDDILYYRVFLPWKFNNFGSIYFLDMYSSLGVAIQI